MGYQDDDRRGGGNRWRDRDDGRWNERGYGDRDREWRGGGRDDWNEGRRERMGWGSGGRDDDRGFFERARDQVGSWFRDDDDDRGDRGRRDHGRDESGRGGGSYGWMSGGWGNQAGESWNRDRPGVRNEREGWFSDSIGGERGERLGGSGGGAGYGRGYGGDAPELWEGGGFGGPSDRGRRFDRVDAGSVGTHGAHPMSAPVGRGFGGAGFGSGSSSRYAAMMREQGGGQGGRHDPHYSEWRRRQIEDLDRDYDEYRREHQSKFEQEFGSWRSKRQAQRQMLNKVAEHMEVVGSDGSVVGTVDDVRGDRIVLTRSHENAGGRHHSIPCSWVESVDDGKVALNRTAEQATAEWRDEERNRALFEREGQGSEGPHALNRSFSGTYSDRDDDR
jgi:hypothetical protein